ncbi:MAG: rod shape-determining protein MreD [bacterium]
MSWLIWIAFLVMTLALQSAAGSHLAIKGIKPDFVLIGVVAFALRKGSVAGEVVGFLAGLIEDCLSFPLLGLNGFSKCLTGFLAGWRQSWNKSIILQLMVILMASIVNSFIILGLSSLFLPQAYFHPSVISQIIIPENLYNVGVGTLFFLFVKLIL